MPEIEWFSEGARHLLEKGLAPRHGEPEGAVSFPLQFRLPAGRLQDDGPNVASSERAEAHYWAWLRHLVDAYAEDDPGRCSLAPNIALFGIVKWKTKEDGTRCLSYVDIQSFVSTGKSIEELLLLDQQDVGSNIFGKLHYHRIDYNPENLGKPFRDPHPHIHSSPKRYPRHALSADRRINVIADFIEYLLRMYVYDDWQNWAERVWKAHLSDLDRETPMLATIIDKHGADDYSTLSKPPYSEAMLEWKDRMEQEKRRMYELSADPDVVHTLTY